jgi:diacylglycerol kinase (ATP)
MSAFVVVNPASEGTSREWPGVEKALSAIYPYMSVAFTRGRGDAAALTADALREGHHEIVAVGSDGTINEVVNGFFDMGGAISPDAVLSFVCCSAASDFKKALGVEESGVQAAERLRHASVRAIDVGRVSFLSKNGMARTRAFVNVASFGLSGEIVDCVNRAVVSKLFGIPFAFAFHSTLGHLTYRGRKVRLIVDGAYDEIVAISTVAVANGRWSGGGMLVAPDAKPDDSWFDVVIFADAPKKRMFDLNVFYAGDYLENRNVQVIRGRKVVAAPVAETRGRAVLIETDGEGVGRLPATFEVLHRALNVRC